MDTSDCADYISIKKYEALQAELAISKSRLSNLLAVLHRDGGHYEEEHGTERATNDAANRYYELQNSIEIIRSERDDWHKLADIRADEIARLQAELSHAQSKSSRLKAPRCGGRTRKND